MFVPALFAPCGRFEMLISRLLFIASFCRSERSEENPSAEERGEAAPREARAPCENKMRSVTPVGLAAKNVHGAEMKGGKAKFEYFGGEEESRLN